MVVVLFVSRIYLDGTKFSRHARLEIHRHSPLRKPPPNHLEMGNSTSNQRSPHHRLEGRKTKDAIILTKPLHTAPAHSRNHYSQPLAAESRPSHTHASSSEAESHFSPTHASLSEAESRSSSCGRSDVFVFNLTSDDSAAFHIEKWLDEQHRHPESLVKETASGPDLAGSTNSLDSLERALIRQGAPSESTYSSLISFERVFPHQAVNKRSPLDQTEGPASGAKQQTYRDCTSSLPVESEAAKSDDQDYLGRHSDVLGTSIGLGIHIPSANLSLDFSHGYLYDSTELEQNHMPTYSNNWPITLNSGTNTHRERSVDSAVSAEPRPHAETANMIEDDFSVMHHGQTESIKIHPTISELYNQIDEVLRLYSSAPYETSNSDLSIASSNIQSDSTKYSDEDMDITEITDINDVPCTLSPPRFSSADLHPHIRWSYEDSPPRPILSTDSEFADACRKDSQQDRSDLEQEMRNTEQTIETPIIDTFVANSARGSAVHWVCRLSGCEGSPHVERDIPTHAT